MTEETFRVGSPPSAPLPPARIKRTRWALIAAAGALVIAATAAATAWLVRDDEAGTAAAPTPFVQTSFTITGELTLERGGFAWDKNPDHCWGRGGYEDIASGLQVVVADNAGKTLALGRLDAGIPDRDPESPELAIRCRFKFTVSGVPEGQEFYGVAVGRRGQLQYRRSELSRALDLELN